MISSPRKKCFILTSFIGEKNHVSSRIHVYLYDLCMYMCRYTDGRGRGKTLSVSKSFSKRLSLDGWSYGASDEGSTPVAGRKPRVCSCPRLDRYSQAVCKYRLHLSVQKGICTKLFSWIFLYFLWAINYSMITYSWLKRVDIMHHFHTSLIHHHSLYQYVINPPRWINLTALI